MPEVLATAEDHQPHLSVPVEFPDGRLLLPTIFFGRCQLLIGKPGGNFFPLVDTVEEKRLPGALLLDNQVAFIAGTGSDQTIAIALADDGRIIRRLQGCKGKYVTSLAASPDGKDLYYATEGSIWAIPAADGTPRKVSAGDGVAVDPNGKEVIINLLDTGGARLVRIPLSGSPEQIINVQGGIRIDPLSLGGNGLRKDGKLLIGVSPRDSWFFSPAVLDVASGELTRIPLNYTGDILLSGWASDGLSWLMANPCEPTSGAFGPCIDRLRSPAHYSCRLL